ncbi:ShlB/FhaC/HecB family hemolysin secretion/activation protein [Roseateles albus]|uniref:ShlB/FhaC/HecB family hemolysin secretion/activation protein n=1 Tax=Roseateles albus TaxID=2987525 RepID=A0ABT5KAP6_9BURK|nr:ShlB/FhaC/HecB family hemolysin secretion/activation protein [Roseateles albus]MDC8771012.1 ShlB/FhaC/HecB family hemolysin secretion/activation protein [Roseateles albus]
MELFHKIRAQTWARLYFRRGFSVAMLPLAGLAIGLASSAPALAQPAVEGATAPAAAAITAPKFDIFEFEIEGNSRLSEMQIEAAVLPFLGPQLGMAEVEAARAALEKAYQMAGYLTVFVDVPEQRVDGGVIRLTVLEGRVGAMYVTGSQYYAQGRIRAAVIELAPGQVPNFNTVQQQIASVSRGEERRVQPVLRPGRVPGTVEAELKVEDKLPLGGSVEISNAAAANTDPVRMAVNLHYDNFLQRDHVVSLSLMGAPLSPRESRVLVFNYTAPLAGGDSLTFSAIDSSSDLESLGGTRVLGRGTTLGFRYGMNRSLAESVHSMSLGFDYKNLTEDVRTSGGVIASPLQYMPLQVGYNGAWWGEALQQQLSVTAVLGLRPLLQKTRDDCQLLDGSFGQADQFACKRRGADGGFATLRGDWRATQRFASSELGLRLSGQLANQALTSAEQFSVGGADTVRGYDEGAVAGDRGLLASLELRSRNLAPGLLAVFEGATLPAFSEIVFYGFADAAQVNLFNPEPGQQGRTPLLGTGLGFRLAVQPGLSLNFDWAQRRKPVPSNPVASSEHVHVRAGLRF